jgi:hypothetical protein
MSHTAKKWLSFFFFDDVFIKIIIAQKQIPVNRNGINKNESRGIGVPTLSNAMKEQ